MTTGQAERVQRGRMGDADGLAAVGAAELQAIAAGLASRSDPRELLRMFVAPRRFADKRFGDYEPQHPSQAVAQERVERLAESLSERRTGIGRLRARFGPKRRRGGGVYLDGGFGVGKTHLLAALWNAAPGPKSYLSFDQLVHFIGLVGVDAARSAFSDRILIAVDEWELDDPGNLKIALAFLRGAIADGVTVAVTSNTLPIELGAGRFSQKDFRNEIEELAGAFEVIRLEGRDYRHRHFEMAPGREYFLPRDVVQSRAAQRNGRFACLEMRDLLGVLAGIHPIRFGTLAERLDGLGVLGVDTIITLPEALRWVHFIDTLYDGETPFVASGAVALGDLFPQEFVEGPYAKKLSRCLSRMEEMLGEP